MNGIYPKYLTPTMPTRCSVIALNLGSSRKGCETEAGSSAAGIALFDYGVEKWRKWVRAYEAPGQARSPLLHERTLSCGRKYLFTDHE